MQFFKAAHVADEKKVSITGMYLLRVMRNCGGEQNLKGM